MTESLLSLDRQLFFLINDSWHNGLFDAVLPVMRNKYTWLPLYAIIGIVLAKKYRLQSIAIIVFCCIAIALSDQLSSTVLKPWVERLRPCNDPALGEQVRLLVECGVGYSFPSSHAANHFSFAFYFGVLFKPWRKWLLALGSLWAAMISFAQVYVGVHYPVDITAGALLGMLTGTVAAMLLVKLFRPKI